MTSIRRLIAASNGMVRIFVFTVAMMLVMQGGIAHFSAAHSHGSRDHAIPHAHSVGDAGHQHDSSTHAPDSAIDHEHAGDETGRDAAHLLNCCGWMCSAAICAEAAFQISPIGTGQADDILVAEMMLDWLPYGPDRPPRPRPQTT
jgi:hypothetical protein